MNHSLSNLGRRPSCEVELKLAAPVAELEKLERALLALPTARLEAQSDLVSTYYDTCTLALHRRRLTLRVRRQGGEFVPRSWICWRGGNGRRQSRAVNPILTR